jgi:DNA-binding NarL/FixJ family response regulator
MTARILIADDNDVIRGCISELVEGHDGWNVCAQVENGKQAVLKATELKPDIVILDMAMPVMNGIEAAGEIGKVMPSMRIVLYTVYNLPVLELKAKKAGVRQVVPKPDGAGLVRAVENLLKEQSEEPESL